MQEVLNVSPADQTAAEMINFTSSTQTTEKESIFQAFATPASTLEFIQSAYLAMKLKHHTATHIILGYRIELDGEIVEGLQHDGEYQANLKITEALTHENMVNFAVFMVRWFGGQHLGGQRLSIVYQLTKQVKDSMLSDAETGEQSFEEGSNDGDKENESELSSEAEGEEATIPKKSTKSTPKKRCLSWNSLNTEVQTCCGMVLSQDQIL